MIERIPNIRGNGAGNAYPAWAGPDRTADDQSNDLSWSQRRLAPRQHIFHQGDDQRYVYAVKSGFVRLYALLCNGQSQIIGFKGAGDFVALENVSKHRFSAQAVVATELRSIPATAFYAAASGDARFLLRLYNTVCDDLSRTHDLVVTIAKRDAEGSMAAFLLDIDTRATARSVRGEFVALPMLRGDIANYLGLTSETVSRIFTSFKKRGFVEVRGRHGMRLINRRALRAIADRMAGERKSTEMNGARLASPAN